MTRRKDIVLIVEDELSEVVMRKIIARHANSLEIESCVRSGGVGNIKKGMLKYRNASHVRPHVVLADLDRHECPAALFADWNVRDLPPALLFRVAVRSVESWLLADRDSIADFLAVPRLKVSRTPETLVDCKREMIFLARKSRKKRLATEICPETGSAAKQGPLYNAHMAHFVREHWREETAAQSSPSLERACRRISEFELRLWNGS